MTTPTPPPCPECSAYKGHFPDCSSTPREDLAQAYRDTKRELREHDTRFIKRICDMTTQITLWQGKHSIVCHENNKLRRKLYDQPTKRTTPSPRPKPSNHGRTRKNAKSS